MRLADFFLTKNTKKSTENFVNTKFRTIFVVQSNNKFYEKIKQKRERLDRSNQEFQSLQRSHGNAMGV